jgi:TP901-1 family phage major tail protein
VASNKVAGVDVLLYVQTGTDQTSGDPIFTVLGGQGDATLNREAEEIDVSAKTDGNGYGDYLAGRKTWSIECEGFIVEDDAAYDTLEQKYEARETLKVELRMPSGKIYSGEVVITEFPLEFPQDDGATFSLTLQGRGPLTITPAS